MGLAWVKCGKKAWRRGSALVKRGLVGSGVGRKLSWVRRRKRRLGGVGEKQQLN